MNKELPYNERVTWPVSVSQGPDIMRPAVDPVNKLCGDGDAPKSLASKQVRILVKCDA